MMMTEIRFKIIKRIFGWRLKGDLPGLVKIISSKIISSLGLVRLSPRKLGPETETIIGVQAWDRDLF
ncbi:hypothetical protein BpHYR1_017162 [Brachionus plicatilis]|uniref:Uncharacterized protein n=1 Tax=Brachionus plicatilis TaxID=10195 RepID=A0A3M7RE58_BRAPC|nr:hypothetical protein BpHYR1_017162 [Brachionus plicatilis]